ncbi:glycoside hydrolase family 92 protein [Baudoinia panamericana UAMH 10762]|uniref:Glycoside hydrolase family 92 protein n=1 Tax=Baudoinia panamericana (strain UAMH 10762) TaxID=717646 RepID=M2N2U4_BAUPA|nr:glycoside hydrolase family 92 protein [Baudoinia panamericana UAMH 10762]EMC92980.1 glycoside hydrolase family 92 protein [Baudoinia panamericana UAMH 10762]
MVLRFYWTRMFLVLLVGVGGIGAVIYAIALLLNLGSVTPGLQTSADNDYTKYVDPFLGTENGGNMFPGVVAAPFSMVKLGPDLTNGNADAYSGYLPEGQIWGFSIMHESGTGGAPKYGVVSQMPVLGDVPNPLIDLSQNRSVSDSAKVGYYKSSLVSGIDIEVSATEHAGYYQYTFPSGSSSSVVVDVSHVLPSFRGLGWGQGYAGGYFGISDDGSAYEGYGVYNGGWNLAPNWTIFFCGHFDQAPMSSKTFIGEGTTIHSYGDNLSTNTTYRHGGVFSFSQSKVASRVGISFISSAQACQNIASEIPPNTSIQTLVSRAQTRWNQQVFSRVTTSETNLTILTQLYTYLYGMMLIPTNRTGENPLWTSNEPYYDDIFTFWDLFRCGTALMHVLQPSAYEEQIRSLIDIWRHEGWLPDARSSDYTGRTQGGSNADNVLADAFVKGVRGMVNWLDGFNAMKTNAEIVPPNNFDAIADDSSTRQGRGALSDWKDYGWITPAFTRAVTRAVEYAVNDFSLYQVASGLGFFADADRYLIRSRNWRNHWNPAQTSFNSSGYLVPRDANGTFVCGRCYWAEPYYEDTPWSYSFNAQHDIYHLIALSGGREAFIERLETFFTPNLTRKNAAYGHTLFDPANEPAFNTPYLFNFVGRQDLSVKYSRSIAMNFYNTGRGGIPGNSDAGSMQSWILWNMIGLYPMTGQTTFLVGSPWFKYLRIALGDGKTLTITSRGGNRNSAYYVQSLKVNGRSWDKAWVTWEDVFAHGGTLDFVLGDEPALWATGTLPPSPASDESPSVFW